MHPLCRKLLYSLPALLTGPGAVLVLLLLVPTLPVFGAVFIMLGVSGAATLSVWVSDIWRMPGRSYFRRVHYMRVGLAYAASYVGLVVTHSALLITLAWLTLFIPDAGSAHDAMVVVTWLVAGISASIAAVHLVRAINPATDLKRYLWVSLAAIAVLALADLGLPAAGAAEATVLTPRNLVEIAGYVALGASLWLVVIVNDHTTRADAPQAPFLSPPREDAVAEAAQPVAPSPAVSVHGRIESEADAALPG